MNSEERQLITDLFDRIRSQGQVDKDNDAEKLIMQGFRQNPDAAYLMVQSVLVQDHALQLSEQRMQELEAEVEDLQNQLRSSRPQQTSSSGGGSFLGGLFGGGAARPAPQPVQNASRSTPSFGGGRQPQQPASPWGSSPQASPQQAPQQAAPASGGGFMKQAMATAAGVAGGVLAANAISGMLGSNSGKSGEQASNSGSSDNSSNSDFASSSDNDPGGYSDASYDSNDAGGWGDDDIEI